MQAEFDTRSKTTENALQLLSNKLTNLAIAVGNAFLPAITAGAKALGAMADALRWVAETRVGQVILTLAGGLAAAVLAVTAFSAGMWAVSKAAPVVSTTLNGIRMALLALGWPVWALDVYKRQHGPCAGCAPHGIATGAHPRAVRGGANGQCQCPGR